MKVLSTAKALAMIFGSRFLQPGEISMLARTCSLPLAVAVLCLCAANVLKTAQAASEAGSRAPLTLADKTLVAWAYPANLTQRGGSLLTVFDRGTEAFDAIVLGEKVPGRWMAGSDFFRRTAGDQAAWPTETADARTTVQIAIVYRGRQISIYRNAKPYAAYLVERPQVFDDNPIVLIGLRYLGGMGEIGCFAGAIEEARIYNTALDPAQIAALKPERAGQGSSVGEDIRPKPLAQWTFEDGTAVDAMRTFPPGQLCGGAKIAGGKLLLNGTDAYMVAARPLQPAPPQHMFFRARTTGGQWDTWLYEHEGTYYLYILAGPGGKWHGIGMATSADGVHWKELGMVLHKAQGVTWLGTGSTWKSPNYDKDKKFFLNFSEWRGPRQTIFFAESTNLTEWKRLGDDREFKQDERWYQPNGRWDCIYAIPRPGGGLYGYWTATPKPETGGRFGFGQTLDGTRWESLAPPKVEGAGEGEAGAVEKLGDRYYMMFGTGGKMVTLVAERPQGPFVAAKKNIVLLAGNTYFSRFFPTRDGMLVNHHSMGQGGVYFAPLKRAAVDGEGTLRLAWWEGNEKLKHEAIEVEMPPSDPKTARPVVMLQSAFPVRDGLVLEGTLELPAAKDAAPRGLYVEHGEGMGTAVLVGAGGVGQIGPMRADGSGFKCEQRADREAKLGPTARFRLLLKQSLLEFYLDDLLMACHGLGQSATGRIGLIHGGTGEHVREVKAWR
jgi:hypothetical protein